MSVCTKLTKVIMVRNCYMQVIVAESVMSSFFTLLNVNGSMLYKVARCHVHLIFKADHKMISGDMSK